jgi:hypothetical protein
LESGSTLTSLQKSTGSCRIWAAEARFRHNGAKLINRTRDAAMRQGNIGDLWPYSPTHNARRNGAPAESPGETSRPPGRRTTDGAAIAIRAQETLASRHFLGFNLNKVG